MAELFTFATGRAGQKVTLNRQEANLLNVLVQSSIRKGGDLIPFYGRAEKIRKAGSFIIGDMKKRGFAVQQSAIASQLKLAGIKPVYAHGRLMGGEVGQMSIGIKELIKEKPQAMTLPEYKRKFREVPKEWLKPSVKKEKVFIPGLKPLNVLEKRFKRPEERITRKKIIGIKKRVKLPTPTFLKKEELKRAIDEISFKSISQPQKQNKLNQQIISSNKAVEIFNRKYGGETLSESEFSKAIKDERELNEDLKKVEELEKEIKKMEEERKKKLKGLPFVKQSIEVKKILEKLKATKIIQKLKISSISPEQRKETKRVQQQALRIEQSKTVRQLIKEENIPGAVRQGFNLAGTKFFSFTDLIKAKTTKGERLSPAELKTGGRIIGELGMFVGLGVTAPTTIEFISKLPTNTMVMFAGKQKVKGNKIITDLVFRSSGRQVGYARGITVNQGKKFVTISGGKFGRKGINFPTGKIKLFERKTFAGIEKGVTKQTMFKLKTDVKNVGAITKNIKGIAQAGFGRSIQVKGDKLIKTGIKFPRGKIIKKKVKGISTSDFISVAGIFTKKDLSLIIGKTLTTKGDKTKFIGLIRGTKKLKTPGVKDGITLNRKQKDLYAKAMKNVLGVVSSSVKANKIKGLSPLAKSTIATITLKTTLITPKIIPKVEVIPKAKIIPKAKVISKIILKKIPKTKIKQIKKQVSKTEQKIKQIKKQVSKTEQKIKQKQKQKEKAKTRTRIKQLQRKMQRQRQKLRAIQKTRQAIKQKIRTTTKIRITPKRVRLLLPPIKRKKIKALKKKPKKKPQAYSVYARPLKKTKKGKRPKLVKVSIMPLSKKRAESLRNYIVDKSLSRTSQIKPTKGKIGKPKLKVPMGYAKKTSQKFRKYKIVKGKRIPLKKGRVIERRKYLLDSRGEKRGLSLRRAIAQLKKKSIKKPIRKIKRKITPPQKKELLKRLKKANQLRES